MGNIFGETLRKLRTDQGLSQQHLAEILYVNRASIASWETGRRIPDATLISRISTVLGTDIARLMNAAEESDGAPHVILVDVGCRFFGISVLFHAHAFIDALSAALLRGRLAKKPYSVSDRRSVVSLLFTACHHTVYDRNLLFYR